MILASKYLAVLTMTISSLAMVSLGHAADPFGNGTIKTPTTASGGTGTAANLQTDDDVNYTVAKGETASIGGFGTHGSAITSVYLFVQYSVEAGYTGTNAIRVNGVDTTIVPALRAYGRWAYVDITGGSFGVDTSAEISTMSVTFNNDDGGSSNSVLFDCAYVVVNPQTAIPAPPSWSEDFNGTGQANPMVWNYEVGYQRNNEDQYYVSGASNGWQEGGNFIIEGRKESVGGFQYTSASIVTNNKYYWKFGRAQIRAKIPAKAGMWPAIWGTGEVGQWPHCGEVDIMEYYDDKILANVAVGTTTAWNAKWDGGNRTLTSLLAVDSNWRNEWHIWTMQWDDVNVRIYVDNILVNTIPQTWMVNTAGYNTSWGPQYPFQSNGMTCWLNLAIGGNAGGDPTATMNSGPQRYLIDYWKVWEGATNNATPTDIALSGSGVAEELAAGTVVGTLSATDADPAEVLRYTLVAGTGSTHNAQFSIPEFISGDTLQGVLKTAAVLNYDDGATRSIRVRVTDIEGATYDKVMTVNVAQSGYLVTYDGNNSTGGSVPVDSNFYAPDSTVTVLGNTGSLVRAGDTFVGWNTAANGSGTTYFAGNTFTISSNVTLYAVWTALPTYTASYDANGATSGTAPSNQTKIEGTSLTLSTNYGNLVKTGYAFAGWNTADTGLGTDYAAGGIYSTDAAVTLYAKWTPSGVLAVTPAGNLTSTGNYGGSFSPSSLEYTLTNSGTASLDWAAGNTAAWLTLSSTGGTLAVGGSTTVTVSINSAANSLNVGNYSDTVSFTNTTNGNGNTTRVGSLTVGKAPQTITFAALGTVLDNSAPIPLTATASSGLPVSYASSNTNVATLSGNNLVIAGPGSTTITASQAGNGNYNAATAVPQTLTVVRANPLAVTNGPYLVLSNQSLSLNGAGSQPSGGQTITSYSWDLNNDGTFGDATGEAPASITFAVLTTTWEMEDGPNTIALQVTDDSLPAGKTSIAYTTVEVVVSPTWDSNGIGALQTDGDGDWTTANQWWNGTSNTNWTSGDDAIFGNNGTGGTVTLASPTTVNSLTFNSFSGAYTLGTSGQAITLNNGITQNAASGAVTIVSPLTLGAAQSWSNNSAGLLTIGPDPVSNGGFLLSIGGTGNTTVSGAIGGAGGLSKSGAGTLSLSGSSGYAGATTVSGGTLVLSNANTIAGATSVAATGTLQLGHATSMGTSTMTLASGTTLQLRNDANTAFTAPIATAPTTGVIYNIDVNNAGGAVTGRTLSLGNLTFATSAVTTTNTINITGGNGYTLGLGTLGAPSSGPGGPHPLIINPTSAAVTITKIDAGSYGTTLNFTGSNNASLGQFSLGSNGNNAIQVNGAAVTLGTTTAFNGRNSGANNVTLSSGTLNLTTTTSIANVRLSGSGTTAAPTFAINGGTLNNTSGSALTLGGLVSATQNNKPTISVGGNFTFGTALSTSANDLNLGTSAVPLTADRTVTVNGTTTLTLDGIVSGNFKLTKNGTGTLTLGGLNTHGNTTVNSGTLKISQTGKLLSSTGANRTVTVNSGATLELYAWQYGLPGGLGEIYFTPVTNLNIDGGTIKYTGVGENSVPNNNSRTFTIGAGGATLDAAGSGTWNMTRNVSTPLDQTTINGLTLTGSGNGQCSNILAGSGGRLTKSGLGTWTLTAANTYTGTTTVSGGTLQVNSPGSLHTSSAVTVGTGTGGTLGGTGTINGSVTVAADGSLAPGASAGTLTIGGTLNISALANGGTGKLNFELDALANTNDRIAVTGTLTIGVGALGFNDFVFTNLGGLQVTGGTPYTLITSGGITAANTLDPASLSGILPGGLLGTLQINGNNIVLAVTSANTAPTISDIANQSVPSGGNTGAINFTVGDNETDPGLLSVTRSSGNPTLVPDGNILIGGSGANRTVTVTPVSGLTGSATITITVTDGGLLTAQDTFVLTVTDNYLSWAALYGVTGGDNGDHDNDGVKNLVEYALVDGGERGLLNGYTITFTKRGLPYGGDLTYDIEGSTLLTAESWSTLAKPPVVENADSISYTFNPGSPVKNFARLKVVKSP